MKNIITIALLSVMVGGTAFANDVLDKEDNPCKSGKILTNNVELTEDQQALAADLKVQKKEFREERHELKKSMTQQHRDILIGYASGEWSRTQVKRQIEASQAEMIERHVDMKDGLLALIDSYDEDQKDQVRDNIDTTRQCMADHQEQFEAQIARKEAHIQKRMEKKGELMINGLELTRNQRAAFDAWQQGQLERFQKRVDARIEGKGAHLEALLDGKMVHNNQADRTEDIHAQSGLMMDFVDTLDEDQRSQLVINIEEMTERAQQRAEKAPKGKRKGAGKQRR